MGEIVGQPDRIVERVPAYHWFVLFILTLVSVLNFVDRQVLYILIEPIRKDLQISDTQIGLLTGVSFAMVYAVAGLWIARVADRGRRNLVIAGAVIVWSAATAIGGLAQNYWQLAASRLGVAAGESGSTPAAHSLITDLFPPSRRAFAVALFATGTPIGVMVGYVGGGWFANHFSWRVALMCVGLPGIAIGLVAGLAIREPRARSAAAAPSAKGAAWALLRLPTYRHMMAAASFYSASAYGLSAFQPSFLIRIHGFSTEQAGLALGLIHGLCGATGTLLGGYLADRLGKRDVRWRQWVPAIGALLSAPFTLAALLVGNGTLAAILMAGPTIGGLLYVAPTFSLAQSIAPAWARATASALLLFAIGLVGQSCGPLFIGLLSDGFAAYGTNGLRIALFIVPLLQLGSALHFYLAGHSLPRLGQIEEA